MHETNSNVELHPEKNLTSSNQKTDSSTTEKILIQLENAEKQSSNNSISNPEENRASNHQNVDFSTTEKILIQLENSEIQDSNNSIPNTIDKEIAPELDSEKPVTLTPLQLPPTQLINLETANVLPQGSILTTYGVHLFPKGQYGAGTGLQTYNISIDGGVTNNFQLGLDWALFDDTLGEKINGNVPYLNVMSFTPKFKYQFLKEWDFSLALSGSLEIGKFTGSYGLYTPNNLQQTSSILIGSLQLAFTYNVTSNFQWHLVPGGFFFPNTINNGGDFYGSFFNIGTGFNYRPLDRLTLFADVNLPVGSSGNAVNNQGQIFRKPVWSAGLTYLQSPTVGIDLYATNALGATPATQVLAFIPNGNQVSAGVNVRYTPDFGQGYPSSFRQGPLVPLLVRDKQF